MTIPFRPTRSVLLAALMALGVGACVPEPEPADNGQTKQESVKFMSENQQKAGVVTTASGLQYEILQAGTGASPKATDKVTVNYRGSLVSGKQFDAGEGISFPLNGVIPGWTEGLQLMKEGAKYRFYIPAELAYGERGAGRVIPPDSALIFDVELVKVGG